MKSTQEITQEVQQLGRWIPAVREQVGHVVVGQKYLVDRLLLGLLANGHILLEGVPGLAKTLTVKTMAACIQTGFQRLQFTPDLLPADLSGAPVVDPQRIIAARSIVNEIYIDDRVKDYIVDVVWATRDPGAYNLKL